MESRYMVDKDKYPKSYQEDQPKKIELSNLEAWRLGNLKEEEMINVSR